MSQLSVLTSSSPFLLALLNALIGMTCLLFGDFNYVLFRSAFMMSVLVFVYLLYTKSDNLLFLTRTLFLGVIGYYPMLIKSIFDESAFFSNYEMSTQGFHVVPIMYVSTSLALLGNEIGLALGSYQMTHRTPHATTQRVKQYRLLFVFSLLLVLFACADSFIHKGSTVMSAGYSSSEQGNSKPIMGVSNGIGIIGLLGMILAQNTVKISFARTVTIASLVIFLGWGTFLKGGRQDVMSALFSLLVVYKMTRHQTPKLSFKVLLIIAVTLVIMELWGTIRDTLHVEGLDIISTIERITKSATGIQRPGVYHWGTVSPIATTFANVVYLVNCNLINLSYGYSLLEFLPRSLPEFIFPDRPESYAWMFGDYDLSAGGGFFELAEAYMNFGLAGPMIVPLVVSFLVSRSYWRAFYDQTIFRYFVLFSFISLWFRGTWYQIFAFYKMFLTAMILYAGFILFCNLLNTRK